MPREFKELPGWSFAIDEVSAGVYRVLGRDLAGRTVEATGPRLKVKIEKCMQAASQMMADSQ
jgi:hypothetical protein